MKWVFLLGLLVFTPVLTAFLAKNPRHLPKAAFVLGLLPFIESRYNVSASPIAWPGWPGMARGIELSLTDSVAIAMLFCGGKFRSPNRVRLAFAAYAAAIFVSWLVSQNGLATSFYVWQVLRAVLVYYAVARASAKSGQVPVALLSGLIAGLAVQAVVATQQFLTGQPNAGGWFGHQNLLGMVGHAVVFPAFAAFLGGYYKKRAALAVVAGMVIAYAGSSRATIGLLVVGLIVTALLSNWHRTSGRKLGFAVAALISVAVVAPLLYSAIQRRSEEQRAGSTEDRRKMISAARMISMDYPLGTGANTYVTIANVGGYSARSGIGWQSSAAPVHNTYYLILVEMGVFGVIAFIGLLLAALTSAVKALREVPPGFAGEYAAGISAGFIALLIHAYVEWITMIYQVHILFAMNLGIVSAILSHASRERLPLTAKAKAQMTALPIDGRALARPFSR